MKKINQKAEKAVKNAAFALKFKSSDPDERKKLRKDRRKKIENTWWNNYISN
jgi:hypothetical protein